MSGYRTAPVLVPLSLLGLVAACEKRMSVSDTTHSVYDLASPAAVDRPAPAALMRVEAGRGSVSEGVPAMSPGLQMPQTPPSQPRAISMIVRNGDVAVQVDSVEAAIVAARQLATSLGGYVGNVAVFTGALQVRSATLELKIPVQRFDDAMAGVTPLGKVERSASTAEDVGEEFVDISARMANAKRLETRLVDLLATRTGKLEDVLAVERELARVREEIERYEGRIRYLGSRVATSTISLSVHEKPPIVATHPGTNIMGLAVVNMWRNFVNVIALGIESLGVLIPVLAFVWAGLWAWRRSRRGSPPPAVARQTL